MNSRIRFRTGITLGIVAAAALVGCGDDDGAQLPSAPDAGDAGVVSSSGETLTTGDTSTPDVDSTSAAPDTTSELDAGTEQSDASSDETSDENTGVDASVSTGDESSDDSTIATVLVDSGVDATSTGEDSTEAPEPDWVGLEVGAGTVTSLAVEPQGNDGYVGLVYDSAGNFYAVGTATDASGDSYMAVTKFKGNGEIDETFGADGVARKNVSVGGSESVRAITLQTVGETTYIVIAGTAQVDPSADGLASAELDAAVVRFTLAGAIDESFGNEGVVSINFNTGVEGVNAAGSAAWLGNDAVWSIGTTQGNKLVLHGEQRNEGVTALGDGGAAERSDVDWVLVRLLSDGTQDNSFGNAGKVTLDLAGAGASARSATVLEDGSIIGSGYLTSDVLGTTTQQPVLYKVNNNGQFDATFATADAWAADGVFHDRVVEGETMRAEAYGATLQGNNLVTMGYGPTNGSGVGSDFIALRFTAAGVHDKTFGTNGVTYIDAAGQRDNGRSLVVLPDQTILGIGGGSRLLDDNTTTVTDGMLVLLSPNGAPIQSFGDKGVRLYELGGSNDFFWAGAVSPDQNSVAIVGIKGATGEGDNADTDGAVLVLPLSHFSN